MDTAAIASRAGSILARDKETLANAVTDALYQTKPSLLEKHGERGRSKCLQDMRYNIEHLQPAVELGDSTIFERYILWLDEMLRSRNVETDDVIRCMTLLRDECAARYGDEGKSIGEIIDAGISALPAERAS